MPCTLRNMRTYMLKAVIVLAAVLGWSASGRADDPVKTLRKAVERSTLNQSGTKPFHLKAVLALSFDRGSWIEANRAGGDLVGFTDTMETGGTLAGVSPDRDYERRTGVAEKRRGLFSRVASRNQRCAD